MQPLGDWAPPQRPETTLQDATLQDGGLANWQLAPARPSQNSAPVPDPMIRTAEAPGRSLARSDQLGHCYLAGMGMGVWWGLIGAVCLFLWCTLSPGSQFAKMLPVVFMLCAMYIALGSLLYGLFGLFGGMSDDAEATCANCGLVLGLLTATLAGLVTFGYLLYFTVAVIVGTVWVSRQLGKSLGCNIEEMRQSIFIVSSAKGVAVTPSRAH